jgi:D-aspartate ligase
MRKRQHGTTGALILGGTHGGLAMARSLGRRGIPVVFVTSDYLITKFSRYVEFSTTWSGPTRPGAAEELIEIGRRHDLAGWVLMPGGDPEALLIARARAQLASFFRVTTPGWKTARWALDKRLTYKRAGALGIAHPKSYYPADRQQVEQLDCHFPMVVKPATRWDSNQFTLAKAWRVDDRAALLFRYDQAVAAAGERNILLQEFLPGGGATQFSYAALWDRGQPAVSLVAQRVRQYPIEFGYSSTFVKTIENAEVEAAAVRFMQSLDYSGLVEVEFKFDARTQSYNILDVNIRGWTWIALGGGAGVDFPYLLWRCAMGETVTPCKGRPGVTWMHFSRDIVAALQEMWMGRISPADYFRSLGAPTEFAAFALDDPLPGIVDLPLLASRMITQRMPLKIRELRQRIARRRNSAIANSAIRV